MPLDGVHRGLRYLPSIEKDMLGETAQMDNLPVETVNPTLARWRKRDGTYGLYVHGNSKVIASDNGQDANLRRGIQRWIRWWYAPLQGTTPQIEVSGYTMDKKKQQPHGFGSDSGAQTSWVDAPGFAVETVATETSRCLQEFITGIVDPRNGRLLPEYGGLHYWVALDVSPASYRVVMSMPRRLTSDQIGRAMGGPGKTFPVEVIMANKPPNMADWQFISHKWLDYAGFMK